MKPINTQTTLEDVSEEYRQFVEKFKPKKTTDDCYTPENIYKTVVDWVCNEYGIDPENIVRPFYPGGDYERFPYTDKSVVVDNPPFSIHAKICTFYIAYEIPFFLFAPYLTNFSGDPQKQMTHIVCREDVVYENGAEIATSFVTNMDGKWFIRSAPDLARRLKAENGKNRQRGKKQLLKYAYPDNVLTATDVGHMSIHGIDFNLKAEDCFFVRKLDAQASKGKGIFGSGFLLSERAAAERAAAERAAAERWELSDREWRIIKSLGNNEARNDGRQEE